jgi:hypothetical protein
MSAPAPGARPTFSATGYSDGLGRRTLVFDREAGGTIERLTLRAEFGAFERALRDRAAQLAVWEGDGLARPKRVHRESPRGPLCVDSEIPAGDRLDDILDTAAEGRSDQPLAGVDVALGLLLDLLPTIDRLHRKGRIVHGAIAPGRLLLTPSGHIVLVDALYGDALERLAWPAGRLWRELGIAAPRRPEFARAGRAGDLSQVGLAALMMLLGRSLAAEDGPDALSAAVEEAREIAELHGGAAFADGLRTIFERLLPGPAPAFEDGPDAVKALRSLVASAMGAEACAIGLAAVAGAMTALPAPELPDLPEAPAMPAPPDAHATPPPSALETAAPALQLRIDVAADVPVSNVAADVAPPGIARAEITSEAVAVAPPGPPADIPNDATALPESGTAVEYGGTSGVLDEAPVEPERPALPASETVPAAPETSPAAHPPLPGALTSARRSKRGRRKDPLRSNTPDAGPPASPSAPAPIAAAPAASAHASPLAPPARPPLVAVRPAPQPSFAQPVFPQAGAVGDPGPRSPYQDATGRGSAPASIVPAAPSPVAAQYPAAPIAVKGGPIGIKGAPAGVKEAPRPRKERPAPNPYDAPRAAPPPPARTGGSRWKIAAAAAVVLLAGLAAGRAYLPMGTEAAATDSRGAGPAAAAAATAPASGTLVLSSTPAGARVLMDGNPAGETPITLDSVPPGRHTLTFVASGGSVTRTVRVVAGETLTLDVPVYSGWLAVDAPIVLQVAQSGRVLGSTQGRLMMPPGRHTITLSNRDLGYQATQVVDIPPGEERRLRLVPATAVNLNAVPWAEVWVDGTRIGETPIAGVSIPLGTRDIVFRHPQYGERKLTPTIRVGDPAAIFVDFTRPGLR